MGSRKILRIGALGLLPGLIGWSAQGHAAAPLTFRGLALGMTKRQVCSDIAGMAFANEVACGTWEGDALSPPLPDPDFDCVAGIPVTTVIRFDRRDDPEARADEVVVTFPHVQYGAMRAWLIRKYGPPEGREVGEVEVSGGVILRGHTLAWRRPGGRIRLLEWFAEPDTAGLLFVRTRAANSLTRLSR